MDDPIERNFKEVKNGFFFILKYTMIPSKDLQQRNLLGCPELKMMHPLDPENRPNLPA